MPTSKKPKKRYDKHKIRDDYILPLEHQTGLFAKSFNFIINELLQNNAQVTAHHVANDFIMIYRFTFLYELLYSDISCQNIREIIENKLNILNELALSPDLQDYAPIEILLSERQLICLMIEQLKDKLFKIRSRLEYAKITKQMIVDFNTYIGIGKPEFKKWVDYDSSNDALFSCDKRLNLSEIIKQKQLGKKAFYDEQLKEIIFLEK